MLDVGAVMPGSLRDSLGLRAVIVPRIRGGRARLHRIGSAQALLALAPSSALQLPYGDGAMVTALAAVVRRLPCFALDVGDDPAETARAVDEALERAAA